MKLAEIIDKYEIVEGYLDHEAEIHKCTSDISESTPKSLLFVLPSVRGNTYENSEKFIKSKALAIVTECPEYFTGSPIPIIKVENARSAYAVAISRSYGIDYRDITFIGVTGTNGKTTTGTMIYKILRESGYSAAFIGTGKILFKEELLSEKYYSMTSPDPDELYKIIKELQKRGCNAIVMEVSSHALALRKVDPIPFDIAVFTGLSEEHLDFHKTMEDYFSAKETLIKRARRAVINCDDAHGMRLYNKYKVKAFGVSANFILDGYAKRISYNGMLSTSFIYRRGLDSTELKINLPGEYNVTNSMLSFEVGAMLNISASIIKKALLSIENIDGRFECIRSDVTVIIDYAHTALALDNLLKTVNSAKNMRQNVTVVFGCGGDRDRSKRPLMAKACEKYSKSVIVTSDNPRSEDPKKIIEDICSGFDLIKPLVIEDRRSAILHSIENAKAGDIIVIAGKGHERYVIDNDGYHDFDEREIIKEAILKRKKSVDEN